MTADSQPAPRTFKALWDGTDTIVHARVVEIGKPEDTGRGHVIARRHKATVLESFKGSLAVGSVFILRQQGGTILVDGAEVTTHSGDPDLSSGDEALLFLVKMAPNEYGYLYGSNSAIAIDPQTHAIKVPGVIKKIDEFKGPTASNSDALLQLFRDRRDHGGTTPVATPGRR